MYIGNINIFWFEYTTVVIFLNTQYIYNVLYYIDIDIFTKGLAPLPAPLFHSAPSIYRLCTD